MTSSFPPIPWITRSSLLNRSRQIVTVLTRHGFGWLLNKLETNFSPRRGPHLPNDKAARAQAVQLRLALTELGATFIKLGQALSSRPDLLPSVYIEELSRLQDDIPPLSFDQIKPSLELEMGQPIEAIFSDFNPQPIASASIGQVYAARLVTGEDIVIKIIRPGVPEIIEQDLDILRDIADWASQHMAIGRAYDLSALIDEFAYTIRAELDYRQEARNAEIFQRNFINDERVYIPNIYWGLTTARIITLERVDGIKINDLNALDAAHIDRQVVAENLMHFALRQVFEFGFYHADPHPGNFFVQPDGALGVLDFGMVGRLNEHLKESLLDIAVAIQRRDADLLIDGLLSTGIYTRSVQRQALRRELDHLIDHISEGAVEDLSASGMMREIMSIALNHNLQFPNELVAMSRAITISEGTCLTLYPNLKLARFAEPYLKDFWHAQRSPESLLPRFSNAAWDGLDLALNSPRQIRRLLMMLERGQMEFSINTEWLKEFSQQMQQMTNRLALAIVLGATIIALGMVMVIYHPQAWQTLGDWVFGLGFVSSLAFGAWLMWSIVRSGKGP